MIASTGDIAIRLLGTDDLGFRVECINHPILAETLNFELPITLEGTQQWFQSVQGREDRVDACIMRKGQLVGFCGLLGIDRRNRKAEIYCFLAPEAQGQGTGSATVRLLAQVAFNELRLERLYAYTLTYNGAMLHMLRRLGWTLEGRLRKDVLHDGQCLDRYVLSLLRSDSAALGLLR